MTVSGPASAGESLVNNTHVFVAVVRLLHKVEIVNEMRLSSSRMRIGHAHRKARLLALPGHLQARAYRASKLKPMHARGVSNQPVARRCGLCNVFMESMHVGNDGPCDATLYRSRTNVLLTGRETQTVINSWRSSSLRMKSLCSTSPSR